MKVFRGHNYRHKKSGGIYRVIGWGIREHDLVRCVIYEDIWYLTVWIRPTEEFGDGRFEPYWGYGTLGPNYVLAAVSLSHREAKRLTNK